MQKPVVQHLTFSRCIAGAIKMWICREAQTEVAATVLKLRP